VDEGAHAEVHAARKLYDGAFGGPAAKDLKVLATEAGRTGQPAAEEAPLQLQGSERAELSERFGE